MLHAPLQSRFHFCCDNVSRSDVDSASFEQGDIIVSVGTEEATDLVQFFIDKNIVCRRSEYIRTAVQRKEADGNDSPVRVYCEPEILREYKFYLLRGFPLRPHAFMADIQGGEDEYAFREPSKAERAAVRNEYAKMAKLYVLAAYLLDFELLNALIDAMACAAHAVRADGQTWFPERDTINIVFDGTIDGDRMRELLITLMVDFGTSKWLKKGRHGMFHEDFLYDCLRLSLGDPGNHALNQSLSRSYDTAKNFHYMPEEDGTYRDIDKAVLRIGK
jgi:hypothetical protein